MTEITLRRPDDWHVHFRDGAILSAVVPFTARQFARAIVMPNLVPPVKTVAEAEAYRSRILAAVPPRVDFEPLMTAYLTDDTDPDELAGGFEAEVFRAVKLYPANATTNSAAGVSDVGRVVPVLERMQQIGMPLLVHGEVTAADVDVFDREKVFLDDVLAPLLRDLPELKVVVEHATTKEAVDFVRAHAPQVAATITAHHLAINRTDIFRGGIRPHLYCLPIAKREAHRLALRAAATSGEACFFLGTDTAPHARETKEAACGCAGIFTATTAIELYAEVFEEEGALDNLEAFASLNGPAFYGLAPNETRVTLRQVSLQVPDSVPADGSTVVPFRAGDTLRWHLEAAG